MPSVVDTRGVAWTYGAEHELADWDTQIKLPIGFQRADDWTIVNSNAIAAQPNPKVYRYGGEINTPPTRTTSGQVTCLEQLLARYSNAKVNYRSNLHIHVRVPGLATCLPLLKRIQLFIHNALPLVINLIEPIPVGTTAAERKRAKRRKVSHHTFLTKHRLAEQLEAKTVLSFFEAEVPRSKAGRVMWHAQPRVCVNLRQLRQTDTIEFRHFPGTLDRNQLQTCVDWCHDFLLTALKELPIEPLWQSYANRAFPPFPPFEYETEVGYQATAAHNGLSQDEIATNIQLILGGRFNGTQAEQDAVQRACGLSRQHL